MSADTTAAAAAEDDERRLALASEIKAWHAHVLFPHSSPEALAEATDLWRRLSALRDAGRIDNEVGRIWASPTGPHNSGQFQVWVAQESFADLIAYLAVNRGSLTVMAHPLTRFQLLDHTERTVWLGEKAKVGTAVLAEMLSADNPQLTTRPPRVTDPSPHYWDFKNGQKQA